MDKPIAWYDPTNGAVSTDKDSPLFTPLGQVLPLFLEEQQITADCPNCEYHRKRAQLWRDEAYKQAGHPLPKREQEPVPENFIDALRFDVAMREWVGLTEEEIAYAYTLEKKFAMQYVDAKLKEKNSG